MIEKWATRDVTAPKVPPAGRRRRGQAFMSVYIALITLAVAAFTILAFTVRDQVWLTNFDEPVARAIQSVQAPWLNWVLIHMSDLGALPYEIPCVGLVVIGLFVLRLRFEAVAILASTLIAGELGTVAKELVHRARPTTSQLHVATYLSDYSFPSGHVIFATVLFGVTFWVAWIAWKPSLLRNVVLLTLVTLIPLMGLSRVYLGEHWPSDVIGSFCLGSIWVAVTVEAILAAKPRLSRWWSGRPHRMWAPGS